MTTSRGDEAPRGTEFLFNRNRLNVALSRAQCLAVVVCGKRLFDAQWKGIADLARLNLLAYAESVADRVLIAKSM
jgi:superfamily I DNA and/or RNA helicase